MLLASYVGVNLALLPLKINLGPDVGEDWQMLRQLPTAVAAGTVYEIDHAGIGFVWSPVAAWIMAGAALLGYWAWAAIHVAAILLLRQPLLIGLALVSYAFWFDVAQGNTVTFVFVAGVLAIGGSRGASLAYFALLVLMPRPLMVPLAVWLLWKDHSLWRPFAAIFVVHAALVVASGDIVPWVASMLNHELAPGITVGPTAWVGRAWLLAGVPLAWLAWRGHLGWASLAVSPYVTPQYLLFLLWELVPGASHSDLARAIPDQAGDAAGAPVKHAAT